MANGGRCHSSAMIPQLVTLHRHPLQSEPDTTMPNVENATEIGTQLEDGPGDITAALSAESIEALKSKPVETFGSIAEIDAELRRLGDPFGEFDAGPVAELRAAKANRERQLEALKRQLDSEVTEAQRRHDEAFKVMNPLHDRVNRLRIRRDLLLHPERFRSARPR